MRIASRTEQKKYPSSAEILTLLLALLSVALIGILSYKEWTAYRRLSEEIVVTQSIAASTAALRSDLSFVEIEQRGFLLTGDEAYIERYQRAVNGIAAASQTLAQAAQSRPHQHEGERQLAPLIRAKLSDLENGINVRRTKGSQAALSVARTQRGEETTDRIQTICADLEHVAYDRLSMQDRAASDAANRARLITITGSALLLGLIVIATVTIDRGIRRREHLYQEAQKALARAEHSEAALARTNEELQQFAYAASHDLQEPLRTIRTFSEVLIEDQTDVNKERSREAMTYIATGVERMTQLIRALLEYSRAGAAVESEMTAIDAGQILDETRAILRGVIEENQAIVTHDALPAVVADKIQFAQVLQNLLGNAIKYRSSEIPRVHVSAREHSSEWIFSVQDNGEGIDPRHVSKVFEPFTRLHGTEMPGSGIGLATCKRIIQRHGGRIWVESEPGKGSTFFFTIPKR